ncbi:MAG: DUF3857 domain-containing protein [Acidobacteria bacterium]|nr:DUF3857 domain-containing protein [Acidobacteriota bacterium]
MKLQRLSLSLLLSLIGLGSVAAYAQQWKPLDPAHVALKAPIVEKDADAEALLWEVYINDNTDTTEYTHLLRVKIFTERGKDTQSKIDIPYLKGVGIKDVAGRTIKPDGTIIELKKDAVFDREVIKFGGFKLRSKSFAMPGVEPGAIIEYRWREISATSDNYLRLYFQREIPVQVVRYYLKPLAGAMYPMKTVTFQGASSNFVKDKDGFFRTEMTNVPAYREESRMPPPDQVRTWMLVYYAPDVRKDPATYWRDLGRQYAEVAKEFMKVNDDIRRVATETIGDATTPEQKLERLFNFCRTKIKNVNDDASGFTEEQLRKLKDNNSPADTLKRGYGTGTDIDFLFAALAQAAGFEARYAKLGDRSRKFFDPNFTNPYFMRAYNIAVKVGDQWRFFDPASTYVPFGMLRWQEEGIQALVCDSKEPVMVRTQLSPADQSRIRRTARLKLTDDGTLEGQVRVEYTGHFAVSMKEEYDDETAEQRETKLRDAVKERLSSAEVSNLKIEHPQDPLKPFVYSYTLRVPGYAERTGKRMFLQPAFFQKGIGQMFATSTRQNDVYFHFPWLEEDLVMMDLPEGYALENADQPSDLGFGELGHYKVNIGVTQDQRILQYKRELRFEGMMFPKSSYTALKSAFDTVHKSDNHALTFKQGAVANVKQ